MLKPRTHCATPHSASLIYITTWSRMSQTSYSKRFTLHDSLDRLMEASRGGSGLTTDPVLAQRAIDIADRQMLATLQCHGVPLAGEGSYGLANSDGVEVSRLDDAAPELAEAVGWLTDRNLIEVVEDEKGTIVRVRDTP